MEKQCSDPVTNRHYFDPQHKQKRLNQAVINKIGHQFLYELNEISTVVIIVGSWRSTSSNNKILELDQALLEVCNVLVCIRE